MKIRLVNEELVQQALYVLLGLAFITAIVSAKPALSDVAIVGKDTVVMTGEITSIERQGFALKHDNGMTIISLEGIENKQKDALADANLIKVGNRVTVTGELDKGDFNKPVIKATNIAVVPATP